MDPTRDIGPTFDPPNERVDVSTILSERSGTVFEELVQHNPSVATLGGSLADVFHSRIDEAEKANDRSEVAQWSKDAVTFWNRLIELHPELPMLRSYADGAAKQDAEVTAWLANPSTQP